MEAIQAIPILILSYFLTLRLAKYFKVNQTTATVIFLLRTIISIFYLPIAKNLDNDAYGYFTFAFDTVTDTYYSTDLIFVITKFLRQYLFLNIFSTTFLFSFIGNVGILALSSNIKTLSENTSKYIKFLYQLLIFFPTIHLWTSCIGKDSITFACINLVIFSLLNIRSRFNILIISSLLLGLVRPFSGLILFFSLTISLIARSNLQTYKKLILGIATIFGIIVFNILNAKRFQFGLGNFELSTLISGLSYYAEVTSEGNNAIQLINMPFPMKIFTFMYRPLFFDANGLYPLLMSFENLVLLLISFLPIIRIIKSFKFMLFNFNSLNIFLITYLISSWSFYALTVANLGTANRYKLMFLPALISLSLIISYKHKKI